MQALNHEFFKSEPKVCELSEMPVLEKEFHETLLKNEVKGQQKQKSWSLSGNQYNPDKPFQSFAISRFGSSKNVQSSNLSKVIKDERDAKNKEKIPQKSFSLSAQ